MTETESKDLDQFLEELGLSFSQYVRSSIALKQQRIPITKRKITAPPPKIDPTLLLEIGRIGNNINQIAKALNKINLEKKSDQFKFVECLTVLQNIQNQLHEALK